jgi:hypothetical protein
LDTSSQIFLGVSSSEVIKAENSLDTSACRCRNRPWGVEREEVREIERRVETGEREMGSEWKREGLRDREGAR